MRGSLSLNGTWDLVHTEDAPEYYAHPVLRGRIPLKAAVPAPIHRVLVDAGVIEDPNIGINSLKARWVEEQFWIYRRSFDVPSGAVGCPARLVFDRLEMNAVVLLNGEEIGRHASAFRPARFDVTGRLREGENFVAVILETGLYATLEKPTYGYSNDRYSRMTKRQWLRKPQYQCGWDWNPRLMNVGILGEARLEWTDGPRLDSVSVFAEPSPDLSAATLHIRAFVEGPNGEGTVAGVLIARVRETGQASSLPVEVAPGSNRFEMRLILDRPRLWWPIGHGDQALYQIDVTFEAGREAAAVTRRTGVRRIDVDQSPHPEGGSHFILRVNGHPVFCKGGNWVPADLLYSDVTPERYRELVRLAREANFNLLRVWGGGPYADPALCDACDEAGILLWHDFPFACAKYPGDDPEFFAEVEREAEFAVREMARHPSVAVWCGNNEIAWGDAEWGWNETPPRRPHDSIFFDLLPGIVARENPSAFYWPSSPYSPGGARPNDPKSGDQHPWEVSIMDPGGADWWRYRSHVDRFPNEGGVLGASPPGTFRAFLPEGSRSLHSSSWDHHDNPLGSMCGHPGDTGRAYQTVRLWTGRDPSEMEWEDYIFTSALLQAEGLAEYILNYRRRMFSSASAIFWMYNDSWPVTHGWTIVDYYRRKKLSYHPVRRAFAPVTVACAEEGGVVTAWGINDTPEPWEGEARWGLFGLAGGRPIDEQKRVVLPANASTALGSFKRAEWEKAGTERSGAFAALERDGTPIAQARLFVRRFGELAFAPPEARIRREGGRVTLESDAFVWGVCLDIEGERPLADNCFDLLPGIPYSLDWDDALGDPAIVRIGSRDAVPGEKT